MGEDHTEAGRPEEFTTDRVLSVFKEADDPREPWTANEVADAVGCSRRTALGKLKVLADDGILGTKKVGGRSRVYWVAGGHADGG